MGRSFIFIASFFQIFYFSALPIQYELAKNILKNYQKSIIPRIDRAPINVSLQLQLYQIIQVNEPQQFLLLNAWMVESWVDQMIGWDPVDYENETEIIVRHDDIWLPDTTLYNSLEMNDVESKKLVHVKLTTLGKHRGAVIEMLYPTIYKISCQLNLRLFPFDMQICRLTFGSWSFDNKLIDYRALRSVDGPIGLSNFLENDAWSVLMTHVFREEKKFLCCANNYTMLKYDLVIQRRPLYYVLNLIAPTAIITFISIIGFFTSVNPFSFVFSDVSSSVHDLRQEKITLGITTLLSMSIMIFMVSDKMPSTSTCVPLIGIFYSLMITIISVGTLAASTVMFIQKLGCVGRPPSRKTMKWTHRVAPFVCIQMPLVMRQAYAKRAKENKIKKRQFLKNNTWTKAYKLVRDTSFKQKSPTPAPTPQPIEPPTVTAPPPLFSLTHQANRIECSESTPNEESITMETSYGSEMLSSRFDRSASRASVLSVLKPTEIQVSPFATRNIAELEWDWVAAVLERSLLIIFTVFFFFSAIGINLIGYFYWLVEKENIQNMDFTV